MLFRGGRSKNLSYCRCFLINYVFRNTLYCDINSNIELNWVSRAQMFSMINAKGGGENVEDQFHHREDI